MFRVPDKVDVFCTPIEGLQKAATATRTRMVNPEVFDKADLLRSHEAPEYRVPIADIMLWKTDCCAAIQVLVE